jgi:hypothetical protein
MPWEIPFIRRREPQYNIGSPRTVRETGTEVHEEYAGIPDPVRDGDFDGKGMRRVAQLFTTFSPWTGFGLSMGAENYGGRLFQPDHAAAFPAGDLGVDAPRRVVARPPSRSSG